MKVFEELTDNQIVARILAGEVTLFALLIRRYNPILFKIGRSYNFSHEDTQDVMQEAYIDAFRNLSKFEHRATFKTWLIKIMLNCCFRVQHRWSSKNIIPADLNEKCKPLFSDDQDMDTNKTVMNKELNTIIENALQTIPDEYRMVFSLREANGLNVQETADVLHISEANVKVRLNRAKAMLRKEIEKSYSFSEIYEFNLIYCDAMVKRVMNTLKIDS